MARIEPDLPAKNANSRFASTGSAQNSGFATQNDHGSPFAHAAKVLPRVLLHGGQAGIRLKAYELPRMRTVSRDHIPNLAWL